MLNIPAIQARAQALMGGMREIPYEPGHRLHHGIRTEALCLQIAEAGGLVVDRDILTIGARIHDIGKDDDEAESHAVRGAHLVRAHFADLLPPEMLAQVAELVEHHFARPNSKWFDGREKPAWRAEILILQDADVLDHFGTPGIWNALHWAAHWRHSPEQTQTFWFESERMNEKRTGRRRSLNYEASRVLFDQRIGEMNAFFERLA